jgi:hypothetical protein
MKQRSFVGWTLYVCSGLLLWAGHFLFGYVFAALACARGFGTWQFGGISIVTWALTLASLLAIAACCVVMYRALSATRRGTTLVDETTRFLHFLAGGIAVLALAGIGGTALSGALPLQCPL